MMIRMAREDDFRLITVVEPVLARAHLCAAKLIFGQQLR